MFKPLCWLLFREQDKGLRVQEFSGTALESHCSKS